MFFFTRHDPQTIQLSVLCSHTRRPSLGAGAGWGPEESQQWISCARLLVCPSQPGFHENTLHGGLCESPLPMGGRGRTPTQQCLLWCSSRMCPAPMASGTLARLRVQPVFPLGSVLILEDSSAISASGTWTMTFLSEWLLNCCDKSP